MAAYNFLETRIYSVLPFSVIFILVFSIKPSILTICGDKTFRQLPLLNDKKPVELPTQQVNVSSRTLCSIKCFSAVSCTGFLYDDNGTCSMFSTRFCSMVYTIDYGTQAYGKHSCSTIVITVIILINSLCILISC